MTCNIAPPTLACPLYIQKSEPIASAEESQSDKKIQRQRFEVTFGIIYP
jgi:hypothetical protein